jgi:hypothetical protein
MEAELVEMVVVGSPPYVFDYEMDPRNVWVTLFYSNETDTAWVFVRDDRRISRPDSSPPEGAEGAGRVFAWESTFGDTR